MASSTAGFRMQASDFARASRSCVRVGARATLLAGLVVLLLGCVDAMASCNGLTATISGTAAGETINGTSGNDVIEGLGGNDIINGLGGNDTICGGDGDDTIDGGDGNDTFFEDAASNGADSFTGGNDIDAVLYSSRSAAVTVTMDGAVANDGAASEGDNVGNTVEDISGSTAADSITGNSSANSITGGSGADALSGADGNDTFLEGALSSGADVFTGGNGVDTVSYALRSAAVTVTMDGAAANDGVASEGDNVGSTVENLISGSGFDVLTGNASDNSIQGGTASDSITGGDGADVLDGGAGFDTFYEGTSSSGADTFVGGADADRVDYSSRSTSVVVTMDGLAADDGASLEGDNAGADIEHVDGGSAADTLTGNASNNAINGGGGADTLSGLGGTDSFYEDTAANGGDTFSGGAGQDSVSYSGRSASLTVTMDGVAANDGESGENDNIGSDIEGITCGSGADVITGNDSDNTIAGQTGNDTLSGGNGNDQFNSINADGADSYDGGAGTDTLAYSRTTALTITMDGSSANDGSSGENDNVGSTIENLVSGDGDDSITGNSSDNVITGNGGADTMITGDGDDTFVETSFSANDVFTGGSGSDTVSYSSRSSSVTVTMDGAAANDGQSGENDSVDSTVENVLAGSGSDSITGNSSDNVITGGAGFDTLSGGDGNDTFAEGTGTSGADVFDGGNGADTVSYANRTSVITVTMDGVAANDGQSGENDSVGATIENVVGGTNNDVITGNNADNVLTGGPNWDTLNGGDGNDTFSEGSSTNGGDTFNGGTGVDVVDYSLRSAALSVTMDGASANDGAASESDNVGSTVENLIGGSAGDTVTGNASGNVITGGAGADSLDGSGGDDTFVEGASPSGADTLTGNIGTDVVDYSLRSAALTVTMDGAAANDGESGENDNVGSTVENLRAGNASDTITGNSVGNYISGGVGSDVISGGGGNDGVDLDDGVTDTGVSSCGSGSDYVRADSADTATGFGDCELVEIDGTPDVTPPSVTFDSFVEGTNPQNQFVTGTTMWVRTSQSGSFAVQIAASDLGSGFNRVDFPALGTNWSPAGGFDDTSPSPYTLTYSWTASAANPGVQNAVGFDLMGNSATASFTIASDLAAPTNPTAADGTGADIDWASSTSMLDATWSGATDASSGVRDYDWCFTTNSTNSCAATGRVAQGLADPAGHAQATGLSLTGGTLYYFCIRTNDNVANASGYTCTDGQRPDVTGPTTPSVANLANLSADGTAVLSWTAATDAGSGIDHYETKVWPDGQDESYGVWRSTGSDQPFANVALGAVPAGTSWKWKWRVRAIDQSTNVGTQSSVADLGTSSSYTTNGVLGTSGDQSSSGLGGGIQVGHATGNLAISATDLNAMGYGVDLSAARTYNHQDAIATYSLRQVSGALDATSAYMSWTLGQHQTASWERRLVRGDDNSTYGHGAADTDAVIKTLTYIDESGHRWAFTPNNSSATIYTSPVGMADSTLTRAAVSPAGPEGDSYTLATRGGSTLYFDDYGRITKETLRNGRSITFTRDGSNSGRVSAISSDDPDGGGSEQPFDLTFTWGSATIAGESFGASGKVAAIADELGRQVRYVYTNVSSVEYLTSVRRYSDSSSSTPLMRTDYTWAAGSGTSARVVTDVDEWVYADDPQTGTSNDELKHHFDIDYTATNQVDKVTEGGTAARSVGSSTEQIPAVADTITDVTYISLTTGGSAGATSDVTVDVGTAADSDVFGTWTYSIDALGRSLVVKNPLEAGASSRAQTSVTYTTSGRVATSTNEAGDVTTMSYDGSGNVTRVTVDAAASGVPDSITDSSNFTSLGDAQTVTDVRSPSGTFLPGWSYAVSACVDSQGANGTFLVTSAGTSGSAAPTWPSSGAVTSGSVTFTKQGCSATSQGVVTSYEFDSLGNVLEKENADGVRECSYFTASGDIDVAYKLSGSECPGAANSAARIPGTLVDNGYDAKGWKIQTTTDDSTTTFTQDDVGQQTEQRLVVDSGDTSKDVVTATVYDGAGRTVRTTRSDPDGTVRNTSTSYTMAGQPAVRTEPNATWPTGLNGSTPAGDQTTTWFSARGREYYTLQPDARIVTQQHDGMGRPVSVSVAHSASNGSPAATSTDYFLSGARKQKTDPAGIITTFDTSIDPPGQSDRPSKIVSPVSGTTTFVYTSQGKLASKVSGAGTFGYAYDGQGQLVQSTYPSGAVELVTYDTRGNVVERRYTPSGGSTESTTRTFTDADKLDTEDQPSGIDTDNTYSSSTGQLEKSVLDEDGTSWTQETRFAWDAAGRLGSQTTEDGTADPITSYTYEDKSGRLKQTERPDGNDDRLVYDVQGRVTESKVVKRSDSSWQGGDTYSYDTQNRITSRARREAGSTFDTAFTYDPAGQLLSETSEYGIVRSYRYGDANTSSFGTDLQRQTLHLTAAPAGTLTLSRIDEIEECLAEAADCAATDEAAIDAAAASLLEPGSIVDPTTLTSAAADVARWLQLRDNRSWDASSAYIVGECVDPGTWGGNRYKVTTAGTTASSEPTWPGSGTVTDGSVVWTLDPCTPVLVLSSNSYDTNSPSKHQLVSQVDRFGTATYFHYDARGNQDYRGSSAYVSTPNQAFDELNRATTLKDVAGSDVSLSWYRDEMMLKSWSVGGVTRTIEYDAGGRIRLVAASGGASWTSEYVYDQAGVSGIKVGGSWYYLDRSRRGDVVGIRDGAGALQATIRYSAYGEVWTDNQALTDRIALGFNGRDGVVSLGDGLYWMGDRVYSAVLGRFVGVDPMEAPAGVTQAGYNYANSDPVNSADPSGRAAGVHAAYCEMVANLRRTSPTSGARIWVKITMPACKAYDAYVNWRWADICIWAHPDKKSTKWCAPRQWFTGGGGTSGKVLHPRLRTPAKKEEETVGTSACMSGSGYMDVSPATLSGWLTNGNPSGCRIWSLIPVEAY